jgi:hypothetical protein
MFAQGQDPDLESSVMESGAECNWMEVTLGGPTTKSYSPELQSGMARFSLCRIWGQ